MEFKVTALVVILDDPTAIKNTEDPEGDASRRLLRNMFNVGAVFRRKAVEPSSTALSLVRYPPTGWGGQVSNRIRCCWSDHDLMQQVNKNRLLHRLTRSLSNDIEGQQ